MKVKPSSCPSFFSTLSHSTSLNGGPPLCSFQLEAGVLARQLVPSSARHTTNTLPVTVLRPATSTWSGIGLTWSNCHKLPVVSLGNVLSASGDEPPC